MNGDGFRSWGAKLSAWGRWGSDDQLGTLNWITPEHVARAARLIVSGESVSLGLPLGKDGPQPPGGPRLNPVHIMTRTALVPPEPGGFQWMDDLLILYPQAATQIDALSHVAYDGQFYNGVPAESVDDNGAAKLGIEVLRKGINGRGVLLDLARFHGADRLPPDHIISPDELEECSSEQNVRVGEGDIVLVRTGWIRELYDHGPRAFMAREPGIGLEATEWLAEHRVAFLASDNFGIEVVPSATGESMPVHCVLVRDMGMYLGEMFDLEQLALLAQRYSRWEFFFTAHPLQILGGVGSPLEPKAIF